MKNVAIFLLVIGLFGFVQTPKSYIEYDAPGEIEFTACATAPVGSLICDGSAISRTGVYARLFAAIGTTYGAGDGSTTFNLPDGRQRFIIGKSASGTGAVLGETGGTIDHLHTVDPPSTASGAPSATSNVTNTLATDPRATAAHTHTTDIAVFNSGTANPPYIALNMIIKY